MTDIKRPRGRPATGENKPIALRLPADVLAEIDARPGNRTQVVIAVLREAFGLPPKA